MNFSTNQVLQFYCVSEAPTMKYVGTSNTKGAGESDADFAARLKAESTYGFLEVANAAGETVRTDLIPRGHVHSVKYKAAGDDTRGLKGIKVQLNSNVNSGAPVAGQEYIVRFLLRGYIGEECTYQKQASYVAKSGDTAGVVYAELAKILLLNLTEDYPIYELFDDSVVRTKKLVAKVVNGACKLYEADDLSTEVTSLTSLVIAEPIPAWKLGTFPEQTMNFSVSTAPIVVSSTEINDWATLTEVSAGSLPNTHIIADMEYFAEGEKGADDVHAFSIITDGNVSLAVDANDATGYNVLSVQYDRTGSRDTVQKSERTLVIVAKSAVSLSSLKTAFEGLM